VKNTEQILVYMVRWYLCNHAKGFDSSIFGGPPMTAGFKTVCVEI
jgi:hypothetical protein